MPSPASKSTIFDRNTTINFSQCAAVWHLLNPHSIPFSSHTIPYRNHNPNPKPDPKRLQEYEGADKKDGRELTCKNIKPIQSLDRFSKWLARYSDPGPGSIDRLELPGQYSGMRKPDPFETVHITGFGPEILVLASMRRPKRL